MGSLIALLPTILTLMNNPAVQQLIQGLTAAGQAQFPGVDPNKAAQAGSTLFDLEHVKWIQTALVLLRTKVDVDGVYGKGTKEAVTAFQKANDLVADGWAGTKTSDALRNSLLKKTNV